MAEISRFIGGWQAGTPLQEGLEDEAHNRTWQPHSLAVAGVGSTTTARRIPAMTLAGEALADIGNSLINNTNESIIVYPMAPSKRKKADTDLGTMILRNMAIVMEREREKRGLTKKELVKLCEITTPYYFRILDATANPSLQVITRISTNLKIPLQDLMLGIKSDDS
ncbi:helix-turn-helix domain-containing protein [Sinorhizobium meliloti]|uniref:helix-turn-helix domain-containing protein n=2 Tax=Rhizobiaceae TaxID=82115 RepID=UPI002072AEBA|nr:helix-turn-helix domain-containing protein [Sinorhizobium meliloti]MCM5689745.1 helix-turn-helix domain-containing protein [Sinorhizobium meliloti]